MKIDLLITGTGMFAGRIALDLAATARVPINVMIAGRNQERLDWLRTAANARAKMFGTLVTVSSHEIDLREPRACSDLISSFQPSIVVQAASIQTSSVISSSREGWGRLVAEGGLSATAVLQALISSRMAAAISSVSPQTHFINCCFPDVVNEMIVAMGHKVLCGTGNVAILSNIFEGAKSRHSLGQGPLRVLAHYQSLAPWREPADRRIGANPPRVFIANDEIGDVFGTFPDVRLTREPAIEVSGASGVTLIQALASSQAWAGHLPGPNGLPGGYPVKLDEQGNLSLNLPDGLCADEAVTWNRSHELKSGVTVDKSTVRFHGRLATCLCDAGFAHADGFDVSDLEKACQELEQVRNRLLEDGN
ncbi:hypothetical protein [Rhizobium laguerreae]|uniref:hypothetical protein n=1 Tax=Rhizobium laguerreae TaxID=1076926 RepID=UPI001C922E96|nr:hypothetical protein [Rhizobium laguerreae]MBY3348411.1 hypothetical protein [Rhizobium laguerreae]MBY3355428.1 hypothetical protein [Rhizobium laguerreae]MBY3369257.1 hypothetical protein [Rhizobium laguerreae]MBY3376565.1 hypothetical protein [Rhizobium laguerreae]MBY3390396.1 hypothetical protein [Rhizobium laguerreae]